MSLPVRRLSVFPLGGAILFPRTQLPLHIFETRYRAMIAEAMARGQRIGMIQPRGAGEPPPLFDMGCIGRIADIQALDDGRFNIVLEGEARFRVVRELEVPTQYRQVEAAPLSPEEDDPGILAASERGILESEAQAFAEKLGYAVDWGAVGRLDDETFVNAVAQLGPFDIASKQALLEADNLSDRSEMLIQFMQFMGRAGDRPGSGTVQ